MSHWKCYPTLLVNLKKCSSIELHKTTIYFNFPEFVELGLRRPSSEKEQDKFCAIHFKNEDHALNDFKAIAEQLKAISSQ